MDPILILAGAMLAVWAVGTWFDGPGWIHILLTAGIFLWAWRIATRKPKSADRAEQKAKR